AGDQHAGQPGADEATAARHGERQPVLPRREPEPAEHEYRQQRRGRHDQPVDEDRVEEQRAQRRMAEDVSPTRPPAPVRVAQGPSGTATTAPTASPVAASADTAAGPACSTRIAINGNASNASQVPSALTAYAAQSHANCRPTGAIQTIGRFDEQTTTRPASHN